MVVYFAYGSNLDRRAMKGRCPGAVPIGLGRCPGHGFFIMEQGYASIRPEPGGTVPGLLWSVPDRDLPALDAYEDVESGLYTKAVATIDRPDGTCIDAMVYIGGTEREGCARPGYMERVIEAAEAVGLPADHCDALRRWLPP